MPVISGGKRPLTDVLTSFIAWYTTCCADVDHNIIFASIPVTKSFWRETGLPDGSRTNVGVNANSHCGGASVSKIHTNLPTYLDCPAGLNSGPAKDYFGVEKTELSVAKLGVSCWNWGKVPTMTRLILLYTVTVFWVASVGTFWCLVPGSSRIQRGKSFAASLGGNRRGKSKSHFSGASIFKIHTPLSNFQAYLLGINAGLSESGFSYEKTASAVAVFGSSNTWLSQ